MAKLSMKQFSDWLGYDPETVSSAIEIVRMSDSDGAYTHAQDMGEDEMAEVIEAIYFEHGSLKDAIQACKEDLGLIEESIDIKMIDQAISNEKDSKQKNELVGIRANVLHKKPLTKSQTELAKKYNILESKENTNKMKTNKMKTKKIKLTELRQLVKQIIKEEQSNKKVIKESWEGVDRDLETSLFEYGFVTKQRPDKDYPDEWFVLYDAGNNKFDTGHIRETELNNIVLGKEWAKPKDIEEFLSFVGTDLEDWLQSSFTNKLSDVLSYWGPDNIMGSSYGGFSKEEAEQMLMQESTKPKTQKIKLTELRQLVKQIIKEEQSNKKVIKESWEGVDRDLETSLFEYGFVTKQRPDKDYPDEWFVLYDAGNNKFDTGHIRETELNNIVLGKEWAKPKDIEEFLSFVGTDLEDWLQSSFTNKLSDVLSYWGPDNIMGSSYGGFSKEEAEQMLMQESTKPKTQKIKLSEVRQLVKGTLKEGSEKTKKYEITFEDVFDFSVTKKTVDLTDSQYEKAKKQKDDKSIVVNKFDPKTQTSWKLIIKNIKEI